MSKYEEINKSPSLGPHREYANSLRVAENFCSKVQGKMHPGMRVYVTGSPELPKSLMYVCWKPPKDHPAGNYATPIFLHDTTSNVNKRIEGVFNTYMRKAKEWFDRKPQEPTLPGLDLEMLDGLV